MLIGIVGPAYAGKSAVSKRLVESLCGDYSIIPFAKPLKDLARWFGWDGKKDDRGRVFLQTLGTEIGRCYNRDFWVDKWLEAVGGTATLNCDIIRTANVISDDVRFDNEVDAILRHQGIVVCVNASLETRRRRAEAKGEKLPPQHASEAWQSLKYGLTVMNEDGELDKVVEQIAKYMTETNREMESNRNRS